MAISLEEIEQFLIADKFTYEFYKNPMRVIVVRMHHEGKRGALHILMADEDRFFSLGVDPRSDDNKGTLNVPIDHPHRSLVFQQMLYANYKNKFGTWGYNPVDHKIRFWIKIPVEDGIFTLGKFEQIMMGAYNALKASTIFETILTTGKVPPEAYEVVFLQEAYEKTLKEQADDKKANYFFNLNDGI